MQTAENSPGGMISSVHCLEVQESFAQNGLSEACDAIQERIMV